MRGRNLVTPPCISKCAFFVPVCAAHLGELTTSFALVRLRSRRTQQTKLLNILRDDYGLEASFEKMDVDCGGELDVASLLHVRVPSEAAPSVSYV